MCVFVCARSYLQHMGSGSVTADLGFPGGSAGKESARNEGDLGSVPGSGKSPREGKGYHSSILAWEVHGLLSPRGRKEPDTTEVT